VVGSPSGAKAFAWKARGFLPEGDTKRGQMIEGGLGIRDRLSPFEVRPCENPCFFVHEVKRKLLSPRETGPLTGPAVGG